MVKSFWMRTESDLSPSRNPLHFCNCPRQGGSGSADFLLLTQVGGDKGGGQTLLHHGSLYPESIAWIQAAERQEVWPRLDNSGGGYFWKRRAQSRQGGVCSASCWLFCQMWAAECVFMCQNELFVLRGHHTQWQTEKPLHGHRHEFAWQILHFLHINTF